MEEFGGFGGVSDFGASAFEHIFFEGGQDAFSDAHFSPMGLGLGATPDDDSACESDRIKEGLVGALSFEGAHRMGGVTEEGDVLSFF